MSTITGNEYDHITISDGTDQTIHYLKDTVAREDVGDLKSAITNISDAFIAGENYNVVGTDYVGVRLNPQTGAVVTDVAAARTKVFPIVPGAQITVKLTYDSRSINRFGIGLSNNEVPQNGDTPEVVQLGNAVISSNQSKEFVNSGNYKYCYVYYWTVAGGVAYEGNSQLVTLSEINTLRQDITKIDFDIASLQKSCATISDFYKGVIQSDGTYDGTPNRASSGIYATNGGCAVLNFMKGDGYEYNVATWDSKHQNYAQIYSDWTTERKKTINAPYFAVFFRKSDNSDITDDERKNLKIGIYTTVGYSSVANYSGKRISILGDSISTYGDDSQAGGTDPRYAPEGCTTTYPGNRIKYPTLGVVEVQATYWYRTIERLGMVLGINDSWAGSRVSWDGTTEDTDIGAEKHLASQTRINHLGLNGSPDIILVNGGTNDFNAHVQIGTVDYSNPITLTDEQIAALPVSTFADAYRTMLIRIMKTYPDAKVIAMTPSFTKATNRSLEEYDNYCETIKEVCDMLGVHVVDTRMNGISIFDLSTYLGDDLHYNYNGMVLVADLLTKDLLFKA